jgi:hypothetical protein
MNGCEEGCRSIIGNNGLEAQRREPADRLPGGRSEAEATDRGRGGVTSSGWESIPAGCTAPAAAAKGIGA